MSRCSHSVEDILGGSPRRCKRESQEGTNFCWQHATSGAKSGTRSASPKTSPKTIKSPPIRTPKKKRVPGETRHVNFAPKIQVRKISPRNKKVKGGIAWAEPVSDLQAECVSSVMDVYGIWDREDLAKATGLNSTDKRLINTCLRIMEGDMPSSPYRKELREFSSFRERERDEYRQRRIARESQKK
jgi:hypothetical protein